MEEEEVEKTITGDQHRRREMSCGKVTREWRICVANVQTCTEKIEH